MEITDKFEGGNVKIISIEDDLIRFTADLRDSYSWFYWAFAVKNAEPNKTYTFQCDNDFLGYFGPAVSHDNINYEWLNKDSTMNSFKYTFRDGEDIVYFSHNFMYHPRRFFEFCDKNKLKVETLTISERGREVPFVKIGNNKDCVLITGRHHACEAPGSFMLEGFVSAWLQNPPKDLSLIIVPFVDYDGVIDGDQGKGRQPHDHNGDYNINEEAIYASVRAIRNLTKKYNIKYAIDFHAPGHCYGDNDNMYIPIKFLDIYDNVKRYSKLLEETTKDYYPHCEKDDIEPNTKWNKVGAKCFSVYMHVVGGADLSLTIETPYFKSREVVFDIEKVINSGKASFMALEKYINS